MRDSSYFAQAGHSPPTSAAIAFGTTAAVVAVLVWYVDDVVTAVALGVVGALAFTLSCHLLASGRFETVARPIVSLLTLPVALGLFGSSALVALTLAASLFPVEDGSLVSTTTLFIAGHVGVVLGSVVAVFGVTLGVRNVVSETTLDRYAVTTLLTGIVPGLTCLALVGHVLVVGDEEAPITGVLGQLWGWLTAGDPLGFGLAGFLFVAALALTGALVALIVLPVTEILEETTFGQQIAPLVPTVGSVLTVGAVAAIILHVFAFGFEFTLSDAERAELLGSTLYGVLDAIATASALRIVLLSVAAIGLSAATLGVSIRWLARQSHEGVVATAGPLVGGVLITLVAFLAAETVYTALVETVIQSFPTETAAEFDQLATEAARVYGEELFTTMLALVLVVATLCFVALVRLALVVGYVSEQAPGYSLASTGVFLGTVAAATIGAPVWLIFGGILCSLLVWDVGHFGTTLGREMGHRTSTRGVEVVHAGATILVGLIGGLGGIVLLSRVEAVFTTPSPTMSLALFAVAIGLISFLAALR